MSAANSKSKKGASRSGRQKAAKEQGSRPLLSSRQLKVLLGVIVLMLVAVPQADNFRCKAACFKRIKTPYPEIACRYECPWPWEKWPFAPGR